LVTGSCSTQRWRAAFTLIELLVVVAVIAILAGLTLSTLGYVNKKGAESRARSEVAALSAAIEQYKLEFGAYPRMDQPASTSLTNQVTTSNLFLALCPMTKNPSANTAAWSNNPTGQVFFEPTPSITQTNGAVISFVDPWGMPYLYRTNTNGGSLVNVGSFDVWSTAGGTNTNNWIRN
jgi:prepilin-type N-terminal cleavage/methylation domain-containing protein